MLQIVDLLAEILLGLHVYLPGAAEQIEIVHVQRAKINLQGIEHLVHRNAHRFGGGAIDIEKQPGSVGAEAGEQIANSRFALAIDYDVVGHLLQRFEVGVAAIFDHHFETAGGAQAFQRRRTQYFHHAIGDFVLQLRLQRGGDRFGGQPGLKAIVKIVEHDVHRPEIWRIGAQQNRLSGNAHGVFDSRHRPRGFFDPLHHLFGAADRSGVGQLQIDNEIAFVLNRNKPLRCGAKADVGQVQQTDVKAQHDQRSSQQLAHGPRVNPRGQIESAIERTEGEAQHLVQRPGDQAAGDRAHSRRQPTGRWSQKCQGSCGCRIPRATTTKTRNRPNPR